MFQKLQKKWNVSTRQFWIIFIVFACTGTTAAYLTRIITGLLGMGPQTHWGWKLLLRLGMLLIGYQIILLFYGFVFGQFKFFWKYERKLLERLRILKPEIPNTNSKFLTSTGITESDVKNRLAIFASGTGTNAKKIIEHFRNHSSIKIELIVSNKTTAGVLEIASVNNIDTLIIEKEKFFRGDAFVPELKERGITFIVLAGFLWKIPDTLISAYPNKIINIHPALLPKYGGKGMYGMNVHAAVIAANEKETGITIHYVDGHYDNGDIIFQAKCELNENDTPETVAQKVHGLEHEHFPRVIEEVITSKL
jgi:formyltetrahydrofolate-dependent phosphoribosylglycinamide formyltransferase